MIKAIVFMLTYLCNLPSFNGDHVRTTAATHMDMGLRDRRKRLRAGSKS